MRWQTKCLIDTCKGVLPFQRQLRALKDRACRYVPNSVQDAYTITQGLQQIDWAKGVRPVDGAYVLEIGTGWQPMIPVLFSLAGAACVYLTDLNRLCRPDTLNAAMHSLRCHKRTILERLSIPESAFDRATRPVPPPGMEARFRELRFAYLAPCDCRQLDIPAASVDIIASRAVLEHIPPDVIRDIFAEAFRLLKPGGLMCHVIDNSDHWEHRDKRINRINFLKFSDPVFRWTYLNSLNYQNRLRHSEYVSMLQAAGFHLLWERRQIDDHALAALESFPLAPRFQAFTPSDIATMTSYLLASRPSAAVLQESRAGLAREPASLPAPPRKVPLGGAPS